ncbi:uncharacterized oxidoreductase YtbE-like [Clytia hemisphaerica]|uniref:NADP-dependent oxidoreductase domain-containing protein n=1 Tax=Clytia hemisphaerica TaxID=252671 RepID=A0A7M5X4X6_9CNID
MTSVNDTIDLGDGNKIPLLGFGCFDIGKADEETGYNAVLTALKAGYRLFDTAAVYGNEESVGKALKDGSIKREEMFVVTKLHSGKHGFESAKESLEDSLRKLGLEYVDLFLIHTPVPGKVLESWKSLIELKKEGKTKSIGVSNFNGDHIQAILDAGLEKPAINQFELHPVFRRDEVVKYCRDNGITIMAYCPLARGRFLKSGDCPLIEEIATKLNKSVSKIFLRWALQNQFVIIPKSANAGRIRDNYELFDFEISEEDMTRISTMDMDISVCKASDVMKFPWNHIKDFDKPGEYKMV